MQGIGRRIVPLHDYPIFITPLLDLHNIYMGRIARGFRLCL